MAHIVKLARPWFHNGRFYEPSQSGVEIDGLEAYAKAHDKKVEDILPSGAKLLKEKDATILPETHPTVTTLSEMAKRPSQGPVEVVEGKTLGKK